LYLIFFYDINKQDRISGKHKYYSHRKGKAQGIGRRKATYPEIL
jgi:hypothetical protein